MTWSKRLFSRPGMWIVIRALTFAMLTIAIVGLSVTHPKIRPRIDLLASKLSGSRPGMSWGAVLYRLVPHAFRTHRNNPYAATRNPRTSAADIAAGAKTFRSRCAHCHGPNGTEGVSANLANGIFAHGASDLALYNTITRGVPGKEMPGVDLPEDTAWQVVAFVRSLAARKGNRSDEIWLEEASLPGPELSYDRLLATHSNPSDWVTYSGAYDSHRYSDLREINRNNVAELEIHWVYQMEAIYSRVESTPLVIDEVMYVTEPNGTSMALDARTGKRLWINERNPTGSIPLCCGRVNRGFAAYENSLFLGTLDAHLRALDARSGELLWDVVVADYRNGYTISVAPLALKDKVIIGISGGEYGIRGFLDAYDAKTGELLWRRHTIPAPGEPGNDSWEGDSWKTGGGPTWVTGSFDPSLNLLYWGVGNPGPLFVGDDREGDNLYTNSVLALDPDDGEIQWHFQFTPHDVHDWDANQVPVLVDMKWDGRDRKVMLWANRNGFFYVLERETGDFLFARQFGKQTWAEGIDSSGRPIVIPNMEPSPEGTLVFPGPTGATNWWSPSYSRQTGLFYIPVLEWGSIFFSTPGPDHVPGLPFVGSADAQLPLDQGRFLVRAIVPETGEARWEHEMPGGLSKRESLAMGGLLSTAGALVFAADQSRFVALDAFTGKELWGLELGGQIVAGPVSYLAGGHQHIAVAAGRSVFTFTLR